MRWSNQSVVIWLSGERWAGREACSFSVKHQFIRQTQQLGLFQGFVAAEKELLLACIPVKVKLLHLLSDTSKRDVKDRNSLFTSQYITCYNMYIYAFFCISRVENTDATTVIKDACLTAHLLQLRLDTDLCHDASCTSVSVVCWDVVQTWDLGICGRR